MLQFNIIIIWIMLYKFGNLMLQFNIIIIQIILYKFGGNQIK